jgi:DNA repair exonuclease SbcCD ATPase subunit
MAHPEGHPLQAFRPEDIAAMTEILSTERDALDALQQRINGLFIDAHPLSEEILQGLRAVSGQLDRFFSVSPERMSQLERDIQVYQEKIRELESFPHMKEQHARLLEKRRNELSQSHASTQVADAGQATSETSAILERLGAKRTDQKKKATSHYQVALVEERRFHQRNNEEDVYHTARRFLEFLTQPPYRRRGAVTFQEDGIRNPDALIERFIREAQEDVDQQLHELRLLLEAKEQEYKDLLDTTNGTLDTKNLVTSLLIAGETLETLPALNHSLHEILSTSRACRQSIAEVLANLQHSIPTLSTLGKPDLANVPEVRSLQEKLEEMKQSLAAQRAANHQMQQRFVAQQTQERETISSLDSLLREQVAASKVFKAKIIPELEQLQRETLMGKTVAEQTLSEVQAQRSRAERAEAIARTLENRVEEFKKIATSNIAASKLQADRQGKELGSRVENAESSLQKVRFELDQERVKNQEAHAIQESLKAELDKIRAQVRTLETQKADAEQRAEKAEVQIKERQKSSDAEIGRVMVEHSRMEEELSSKLRRGQETVFQLTAALERKDQELISFEDHFEELSAELIHFKKLSGNSDRKHNEKAQKVAELSQQVSQMTDERAALKQAIERLQMELHQLREAYIAEKNGRVDAEGRATSLASRLEKIEMELEAIYTCTIRKRLLSLVELGRSLDLSVEDFQKLLSATLPESVLETLSSHINSQNRKIPFLNNPYGVLQQIVDESALSKGFRETSHVFRKGNDVERQLEIAFCAISRIRTPRGGSFELTKYDINDKALEYLEDQLSPDCFQELLRKIQKTGRFNNEIHMHWSLKRIDDLRTFLPRVILSDVENLFQPLLKRV